jgi:hypothetical protein
MGASTVLAEIKRLDPVRDHQRITFLSCRVDFPWDTTRALELALFRTFCVPSISALLDRTREFAERPQKRYDDTDIIVSEMMEHGYDSDRGRAALNRMNALHARFRIRNEDYLYVLSTFVFEPIRWNARFGWRRMIDAERIALFHFWREVGVRMGIRDIPEDYSLFERYNVDYEKAHYRFTETNRRVGTATRDLFKSWFPGFLGPAVEWSIYAILEEPLLVAFGFPSPPRLLRGVVAGSLRMRGRLLRLLPRRTRPVLRTSMCPRSYPEGYDVTRLGPPHPPEGMPQP